METLLTMPIGEEVAGRYFERFEPNGEGVVKITTMQRFGQKTATGIMASFSIVKQFDGYAMEISAPYSVPCVRIPLASATPPSRKVRFNMEVKTAISNWIRQTNVEQDHPYYVALNKLVEEM